MSQRQHCHSPTHSNRRNEWGTRRRLPAPRPHIPLRLDHPDGAAASRGLQLVCHQPLRCRKGCRWCRMVTLLTGYEPSENRREVVKRGVLPAVLRVGQLENISQIVRALAKCGAVQTACGIQGERCPRPAIISWLSGKAIEQLECPAVPRRATARRRSRRRCCRRRWLPRRDCRRCRSSSPAIGYSPSPPPWKSWMFVSVHPFP